MFAVFMFIVLVVTWSVIAIRAFSTSCNPLTKGWKLMLSGATAVIMAVIASSPKGYANELELFGLLMPRLVLPKGGHWTLLAFSEEDIATYAAPYMGYITFAWVLPLVGAVLLIWGIVQLHKEQN